MRKAVSAIAALLVATFFLYTGNGLQGTLLSVRANAEGFAVPMIGVLMAAYYVGFIVGCRKVPAIIQSAGHIRTYVALASIASSSALAHAILVDTSFWVFLRAVTGFCFAGMAMVIESWINERATNKNRGQILSVYRIVDLGALTLGNALLSVASPSGFQLFALVSILISLALVPIALTRTEPPKAVTAAKLDIKGLFRLSPVGAIGAMATGLANAAFWSMAPVFASQSGYPASVTGLFMSTVIIGAAAAQWPLGWLSDKIDRRFVIVGAGGIGAVCAAALAQYGANGLVYLMGIGALYGGFIIPQFGLCLAHANDHAKPGETVATNGGLFLLHGFGAVVGAVLAAVLMGAFGPKALFIYIAAIYGLFVIIVIARMVHRPAIAKARKGSFIPMPRNAAPTVFAIARRKKSAAPKKDTKKGAGKT